MLLLILEKILRIPLKKILVLGVIDTSDRFFSLESRLMVPIHDI